MAELFNARASIVARARPRKPAAQAKTPALGGGRCATSTNASMHGRLGGEDPGGLPHVELVPHVLGTLVAVEKRAEDHRDEPERDRDQARVAQLEQRLFEADDRGPAVADLLESGLRGGLLLLRRGDRRLDLVLG